MNTLIETETNVYRCAILHIDSCIYILVHCKKPIAWNSGNINIGESTVVFNEHVLCDFFFVGDEHAYIRELEEHTFTLTLE
jgi:hypothetical protein